MIEVEEQIKDFFEKTFNQPLKKKQVKMALKYIFEEVFDSLIKTGVYTFPKGYGSLRVKKLKSFTLSQEKNQCKIIHGKKVVRYFPGNFIKRRLQDG